MLTAHELIEEFRIQEQAIRSHKKYIGYARELGGSAATYWIDRARYSRLTYIESVEFVKTYNK